MMHSAMPWRFPTRWRRLGAAGLSLALVCGCGALTPAVTPHPRLFSLADARGAAQVAPQTGTTAAAAAPTLIVSPPHAAAGFDSPHIVYVRQASQLEYYARNEWVDTPARMLAPLIVAAIEQGGAFRAVVQTPSTVAGDMRLDTEVLRLQHEFLSKPSRVRFTLRAYLVDSVTRRVLASREFEAVAAAPSEDAYGGVMAANEAVRSVLEDLAAFCVETAASRGTRRATEAIPR
jgi:cholesterol transport system auxiliary component